MGGRVRARRLVGALLVATSVVAGVGPTEPAGATTATAGQLIISEFRVRGPNGANDEFIEIYNASGADLTVDAAAGSSGYGVAASDGTTRCTIPNGTVLPDRGHYLCVNSVGYSLASYPAGNGTTATGDATYTTDIPDNAGIAIFNNSAGGAEYSLANRLDAVGSTSEANTLYKEGTGYPALTPFSINYSFYRNTSTSSITSATPGPAGNPQDTNNNAADFVFVDTNGTSAGAGQRLGAPGPENLSSPLSAGLEVNLLDPCVSASSPPNAVRDFTSDPPNNSTFGTLDVRRTIVNNTGGNVTRMRLRVSDLRTFPAPSGIADLRPRSSTAVVVTVDRPPCTSGTSNVTVNGTTLEQPPSQPNGGGFNSSMSVGVITLATPLANGASVDVRLLLGVQQTGASAVQVFAEALPGGPAPVLDCFGPGIEGDDMCSNTAPVADPDGPYAATEDTQLVVSQANGVLTGDTDTDIPLQSLEAVVTDDVDHGALVLAANGSFTYQPDPDFNGNDQFTYVADDGTDQSDEQVVSIQVGPVADAPVGGSDTGSTDQDTPLVVPAPGVLGNDSDADGDPLTVDTTLTVGPTNGTLSLAADGSYSYTADEGFAGTDTFTYVPTDGGLDGAPTTVTITVSDVDHPPVAGTDAFVTPSNAALVVPVATGVLADDSDPDGDPLTAELVTDTAHGTLVLAADGSFTYVPAVGFDGTDSFTYRAVAGALESVPATVTIDVDFAPPATPPTGSGLAVSDATPTPGQPVQLVASGFQPGETVRFVLYSTPLVLGASVADGAGTATLDVVIPASAAPGAHTLSAFAAAKVASAPITIEQVPATTTTTTAAPQPSALPRTGSDTGSGLLLAGFLLAAGGVLLLWPERRRVAAA